ncbi:MAG: transglycosylase SLT domain-containing protein [Planctomycetes bacterium]|nr:transglycosylase SLT domain-containing protein [Planctomycetota bacterium]
MSARRSPRPRRAGTRGTGGIRRVLGGRFLLLVAIATACVVWVGMTEGPKFARQVWSLIGVHQVEAHAEILRAAAKESAVDPCLLAGLMYVESRGKVEALSNKGARGLFQLQSAAASDSAKRLGLPAPSDDELMHDAALNTRLGAAHLAWLIRREGPDLERVLVGYNAGRGRLASWLKDAGGWDAWRARQLEKDTNGALTYARDVLDFAQRFRERGVIVPLPEEAALAPEQPAAVESSGAQAPASER